MRNTDEYPITIDEIIEACDRAAAAKVREYEQTGMVGDIDAAALALAAVWLRRLDSLVRPAPTLLDDEDEENT